MGCAIENKYGGGLKVDRLKEIEERMEKVRSPFKTAESFLAEEIVDPRDTRKLICELCNMMSF